MKNSINVIEISHRFIKLVVGDFINDKVSVRYAKKIPISGLLENGGAIDKENLIAAISKLNPINDESFHMNRLIDEAVLVLPPYGLEIYNTSQMRRNIFIWSNFLKIFLKCLFFLL